MPGPVVGTVRRTKIHKGGDAFGNCAGDLGSIPTGGGWMDQVAALGDGVRRAFTARFSRPIRAFPVSPYGRGAVLVKTDTRYVSPAGANI